MKAKHLAMVGVCLLCVPVAGANLLRNPGFEEPLRNADSNWVAWGTAAVRTNIHPFSGEACFRICGSNQMGGLYQYVPVTAGTMYEASFQFRWDENWSAGQREFEIEWRRGDGSSISTNTFPVGFAGNPSMWHHSGHYPLVAPDEAARAEIRFDYSRVTPSNAFFFIDDVVFEEAAPPPAAEDSGRSRAFFRCETTNILDRAGVPFIARGLALSGWFFPEGYMFGILKDYAKWKQLNTHTEIRNRFERLLGGEAASEQFWDVYRSNFMTEADIAMFRNEFGVNMVRFPFNYRDLSPENNPGAYRKKGFAEMDKVIRWCAANDLYVILDMHSCPGGASSEPSGDPEHLFDLWNKATQRWEEHAIGCLWETNSWGYTYNTGRTPESNAERTADLWRHIADRYKDEEQIIGYEVINEPFLPNRGWSWEVAADPTNQMRATFMKVTRAIREVDTNHIVFVSGDWFSEQFQGMVPPWESNMAIAVHRYWKETGFQDGVMQEYLDARDKYRVPFWLSESGENSNPWFYDIARLFESNNIGWTWWAWKKTGSIAAGFASEIPASFQYVIDNLWHSDIDTNRVRQGLYDLAEAFRTENCRRNDGYFAALFDTSGWFNVRSMPFKEHRAPDTVPFADYDMGNQGVAYSDSAYWNTNFSSPVDYNKGWVYRNDGVDIARNGDGSGYKVFHTEDGEWLNYTIDFTCEGAYDIGICYATAWTNRKIRITWDTTNDLMGEFGMPCTGGWENWRTQVCRNVSVPASGVHTLKVEVVTGGIDFSRMDLSVSEIGSP
jgi:endoglucanase